MAISMLKIRRPLGRLIFNMGIAIPGKTVFLIETAPCFWPSIPYIFLLDIQHSRFPVCSKKSTLNIMPPTLSTVLHDTICRVYTKYSWTFYFRFNFITRLFSFLFFFLGVGCVFILHCLSCTTRKINLISFDLSFRKYQVKNAWVKRQLIQ